MTKLKSIQIEFNYKEGIISHQLQASPLCTHNHKRKKTTWKSSRRFLVKKLDRAINFHGRKPTKGTGAIKWWFARGAAVPFCWITIPMASTTAMINSIASFTRAMHISNLCITIFICSLLLPSASLSLTFQIKATDTHIYIYI